MTASDRTYVQALTLAIDPSWRRLPRAERHEDACRLLEANDAAAGDSVASFSYSTIGLQPDNELLFWRLAPSVDALDQAAARLLRSGVGRWATIRHAFVARTGPSQYVSKPTSQEQSLFDGERSRYLIVYPFTKSTEWYLLSREARQGVMNEHMRVGRDYPQVRQLLAYSFGLDEGDFLVAYETDDLAAFGELVRALRATESRRSTVNDTPILLGVHRPLEETLAMLGG